MPAQSWHNIRQTDKGLMFQNIKLFTFSVLKNPFFKRWRILPFSASHGGGILLASLNRAYIFLLFSNLGDSLNYIPIICVFLFHLYNLYIPIFPIVLIYTCWVFCLIHNCFTSSTMVPALP